MKKVYKRKSGKRGPVRAKKVSYDGIDFEIGRASCRERVQISGVAVSLKKKERRKERVKNDKKKKTSKKSVNR